jgi:hypothetical protein
MSGVVPVADRVGARAGGVVSGADSVPGADRVVPGIDRIVELIAVVVLGITTIGTAWCGYQATQWSAKSGDLTQLANEKQVEGARLFGAATQVISYDSMIVAMYAEARAEGKPGLVKFYRDTLIRPKFLPILNRWEAQVQAGQTPTSLAEDQDYVADQLAGYNNAVAAGQEATRESQQASDTANGYVATTILLAVALFFAGVTSSFRYRPARIAILIAAAGAIAAAASRLADLPIA